MLRGDEEHEAAWAGLANKAADFAADKPVVPGDFVIKFYVKQEGKEGGWGFAPD